MITDLRLQHFRSYDDASFEFQPGVNIIVGPNASGKTNLLEAVLVLASGSSYRVSDAELVQRQQSWARLDSHDSDDHGRTMKIVLDPRPAKTFELGGKIIRRLSMRDATLKLMRVGKFALIVPVMMSTEGRWVAMMR